MNGNQHDDESRGEFSLGGLRDDGGRPLPTSGNEILALGQRALRRRRTAQVAIAGVAALAVLGGGVAFATTRGNTAADTRIATDPSTPSPTSMPSGSPSSTPTGTPTESSTGSPASTQGAGLAPNPLLTRVDLPAVGKVTWTSNTLQATEGECEQPLARQRYEQVNFTAQGVGDRADQTFGAVSVAGEAVSVAKAEQIFTSTVEEHSACPNASGEVTTQPGRWGDQSQVWRTSSPCTTPSTGCEPISAFTAVGRKGRVLVSVSFVVIGAAGTTLSDEFSQAEGDELLAKALNSAVVAE